MRGGKVVHVKGGLQRPSEREWDTRKAPPGTAVERRWKKVKELDAKGDSLTVKKLRACLVTEGDDTEK